MEQTVDHLYEDLEHFMRVEESEALIQSMINKTVKVVKREVKLKAEENYIKILSKIDDLNKDFKALE